jgi:hypothetical protein
MRGRYLALCAVLTALTANSSGAQVRVNPTGVNVNSMDATTVFLTFGGVPATMRPAEAFWCGELVSAAPDLGTRCQPGTIFGQLPARYDLSQRSGTNGFTDIMSIPASVARRAYQDALRGAAPNFFYVRRFVNLAGGPDEFVSVTCRISNGGARVPFSFTNVTVHFADGDEVQFVQSGVVPPPFTAQINHNGTGRLVGRWEVVRPGEEVPDASDLLTEATLPIERRAAQRRFSLVERFDVFVPPGGRFTLPGPDPARLPTSAEGSYLVLLRIEAADDREGDSNLGSTGAGSGVVHSGAVAGFPMPVLRYVVLGDGAASSAGGFARLAQLAPRDGGPVAEDSVTRLVWSSHRGASYYRVEVQTIAGSNVLRALVPQAILHYVLPGIARQPGEIFRWRVTAMDASGRLLRRTPWRRLGAVQ